MIDDEIRKAIYSPTVSTTLNHLTKFQDYHCQNFKGKYKRYEDMKPISNYEDMKPISNQPGKIHATTKTHQFHSLKNITIQNLKFHPIISQIGSYTYNAAKVLSDYVKTLCQNQYKINDTQSIASQIKKQPPLDEDEECASYDVDSSFINIPVQETFDYIIHQIYTDKKLPHICSKTIFRRLLLKMPTECSFQLKQKLCKQQRVVLWEVHCQ